MLGITGQLFPELVVDFIVICTDVAAAMDNIIAKNIFSGTGGELTGKVKAQVITTSTADVSLV